MVVSLAATLCTGDILARGLSSGRRLRCRPMLGDGRGFATDLSAVYLPWPLPDDCQNRLAAAIALQCSPSKEQIAQLPLAPLSGRERIALQWVEGAAAMAWVIERWPGLAQSVRALAPALEPVAMPVSDGGALLRQALQLARTIRHLQSYPGLGQLPLVRGALVDFAARRSQLEARLPWSQKKRLERLNNWSVAIGGGADSADTDAKRSGTLDPGAEDLAVAQRKSRLGIPYPEWDELQQRYREDFVSVFETRRAIAARPWSEADPRLVAWFEQPLERRWYGRLEDGSEIDIDALVEMRMDDLAITRHGERCYRARLQSTRDVACALLLDRSGSLAHGHHLRHEVACCNALTMAMARAGERYGVFAFWSDTREHVAFEVQRDFDDKQPPMLQPSDLHPHGYTRIGAALRHATARLRREPAAKRVLIVLSDAVPCDEGYEGAFAAADVAKAVEEAAAAMVTTAFVGIGRPHDDPLAECLADKLVRIDSIDGLAPVLANVHARLVS